MATEECVKRRKEEKRGKQIEKGRELPKLHQLGFK
jgi:hypothetical protein